MARNTYFSMSDGDLQAMAGVVNSTMSTSAAAYGVSGAQAAALNTAFTEFGTARSDAASAEADFHSAIEDKSAAREALLANLSTIAKVIYNNTAVTPAMIAAAGYQPRDEERTPVVPQTPTDFQAEPFANGTVQFGWGRNGNPYGVVFVLEHSPNGTSWSQIWSGRQSKAKLEGFTPGVLGWFRVRARTATLFSDWSTPEAIYGTGDDQVPLAIAA